MVSISEYVGKHREYVQKKVQDTQNNISLHDLKVPKQ